MEGDIRVVVIKKVEKQLTKLPIAIVEAFATWRMSLYFVGMQETRKTKGYHDEPLQGERFGQRSVRLSRAYRLIYIQYKEEIVVIKVIDISKHKY